MNPTTIKLGLIALDQIAAWTATYVKARDNPGMTEEEADKLVQDTQARAQATVAAWKDYRAGS